MSQSKPATDVHPQEAMLRLISGFWISRGIYVITKLGIPDLLKKGAQTAAELAEQTESHAPSLQRILRALSSVGVVEQTGDGRYGLTPLSETLVTDMPGTLRWFAMSELGEEHYPAWGNVMHSVKTGDIAFDHLFGMDVWEFFRQNPENAKIFNDSMSGMTSVANQALIAAYDFSPIKLLVDIGGGHGRLISSILKINPQMRGILFDAPEVIAGASSQLEAAGVSDRCERVGGDFFKAVPPGGDGYMMKWIIHDWDDERAATILKNCRNAITADGKLLVMDVVVPAGNEPHFGKFIDLNMLVMTGGKERTEEEFRELFATAGFELTRVVPSASPFSIVEGVPA